MQALIMRMSKDIEDRKKNKENLSYSLKERLEECNRLTHENDMLGLELVQSKNNEQELERQIIIMRDELRTTKTNSRLVMLNLMNL